MANKVKFGLEKVHIAFKGVAQTQSIEVTEPPSTDGEVTLTITATTLLGTDSPHDVVVPLASETHTTTAKVASAVCNALNNDEVISAVFMARRVGAAVYLATKVAQDNDATLAIAFADTGETGAEMGDSAVVAAGTVGWGTPVAIPGAVNLTMNPEGGETAFYADNRKYYSRFTNNGYSGTLELALVPDDVLAEMLGWEVDDKGMLVEVADGQPKAFALLGQVLGDERNRRFVYYNCLASRPADNAATTTDTATPTTETLNITILPIDHNGKKIVKSVIECDETNAAIFDGWFDEVELPGQEG
jgi:phi13 family phage major tail protein